jgi:putative SOS response-associated peptidase YedK
MCANYTPGRNERIVRHFGIEDQHGDLERGIFSLAPEAFPATLAPIVRPKRTHGDALEVAAACFGMVPHWADLKLARSTYNARSETVAAKPSFRNAWKNKQFCLVPAEHIFEPSYASGKAERWRIGHVDDRPLAIAGIWEWRPQGPDGAPLLSFAMLTINADDHPLMRNFHKPGEEKRMVALLDPPQYRAWLDGSLPLEQALAPYPAEQLIACADPLPPRTRKAPTAPAPGPDSAA